MAQIYEVEGGSWCLSDRLLFLEAIGRLDGADCDPRIRTERWVEPKPNGAFVIHHQDVPAGVTLAFGWAPVTVQEYREFVKSDGFLDDAVWKDTPSEVLNSRNVLSSLVQRQMRHPNRPVVSVSLYAALAYCAWKSKGRSDARIIRLPEMAEFRKLVGSSPNAKELFDTRNWPIGEKALVNCLGAGLGHPSPVGAFPFKMCGAVDVVGNVWEWVLPSTKQQGKRSLERGPRVEYTSVAGGAYDAPPRFFKEMFAYPPYEFAFSGYDSIGFRCVLSATGLDIDAYLLRLRTFSDHFVKQATNVTRRPNKNPDSRQRIPR